jgi:hypothetical protein
MIIKETRKDMEKWRLIKELDGRYQKRTDTEVPIQPVPDCDFGRPDKEPSFLSTLLPLLIAAAFGAFAMWLLMAVFGG